MTEELAWCCNDVNGNVKLLSLCQDGTCHNTMTGNHIAVSKHSVENDSQQRMLL
jgi:hypothetical protein